MPRITRAESFVYRAPIAVPVVNAFGAMTERVAVFLRLEDSDGAAGWGEIWANFPTLGAEHRARLFDAFIAPRLLGREIGDPRAFWHETDRALHLWGLQAGEPGAFAGALAGADIALHDLCARRAGLPLWRWLGGTDGAPLPCYASGLNPDAMALAQVEAARARGYRAFKIKIGFGEERDLATLAPVFASLRDGERCMVDINQGWDVAQATRMGGVLAQFPLAWIEEPLAADRPAWEWAQVRAAARAPLAAGENLRGALAYHQALAEGHLAVVQPDACKWGGLTGTLPVAQAVVGAGRMYCPHFLGGGIGQLASLHLLAAVRGSGLLEWDANPNPLREDLLEGVLTLRDGLVAVPDGLGLGTEPDLAPFAPHLALHTDRRA
jgi:L-alanine-DL-glutamate epimerase-like enolase superfamily enzyme